MITNVPTADDFAEHGIMFLNFAWDSVFDLLLDYSEAEDWGAIWDNTQTEDYWRAAKKPLSIAHALAQQGAELILKARIAMVSPYLLIVAPPKDWPRSYDKQHIPFADFRTVDAQDLMRVYNTVCANPLPGEFAATFDKFRKQRNALFHTVDTRLEFSEKEVVNYILDAASVISSQRWPALRKAYLSEQPTSHLSTTDDTMNVLCREMECMITMVEGAKLVSLFGFNKRQRRYICPRCYDACDHEHDRDYDYYPRTAQLHPNTPQSTNIRCFVCGEDTGVTRNKCHAEECKGNVIRAGEWPVCLTCFEEQEEAG